MATKKKTSTNTDFTSMKEEDLMNNIKDAQTRLKRMQFSHAITPIENPMQIRILKKDIARMHTENTKRKQA